MHYLVLSTLLLFAAADEKLSLAESLPHFEKIDKKLDQGKIEAADVSAAKVGDFVRIYLRAKPGDELQVTSAIISSSVSGRTKKGDEQRVLRLDVATQGRFLDGIVLDTKGKFVGVVIISSSRGIEVRPAAAILKDQ